VWKEEGRGMWVEGEGESVGWSRSWVRGGEWRGGKARGGG